MKRDRADSNDSEPVVSYPIATPADLALKEALKAQARKNRKDASNVVGTIPLGPTYNKMDELGDAIVIALQSRIVATLDPNINSDSLDAPQEEQNQTFVPMFDSNGNPIEGVFDEQTLAWWSKCLEPWADALSSRRADSCFVRECYLQSVQDFLEFIVKSWELHFAQYSIISCNDVNRNTGVTVFY